jgi:ferric-dicitrate binding protein FerR (iron transport regulator)
VEAYENDDETYVTLVDGAVNVQNNTGQVLARLNPGQRVVYGKNSGSLMLDEIEPDYYAMWKNGVYNYTNESLGEIAEKLERMYNVTIVFDDMATKKVKYTGSILKSKPIDQILDVFKYTSSVDYSIEVRNNKPNLIKIKRN